MSASRTPKRSNTSLPKVSLNTPLKSRTVSTEEQTANLLISEHVRVSEMYKQTAEMGDKYFTSYLTILSLTVALLAGLSQLGIDTPEAVSAELAVMLVLWVIGMGIFRRLINRRTDMICYLRAINRIHHYFIQHDPELKNYLYWKPHDDNPSLFLKGTFLGGLRDNMVVLISFTAGMCFFLILRLTNPPFSDTISIVASVIIGLLSMPILESYGKKILANEDIAMKDNIRFPDKTDPESQTLRSPETKRHRDLPGKLQNLAIRKSKKR